MLITKSLYFILTPLGTALIVFSLALILMQKKKYQVALGFLGFGFFWLLAWSLPIVSLTFRSIVESEFEFQPAENYQNSSGIVLLGGGVEGPSKKFRMPDLNRAADRIWFAARLYNAGKAPLILVSGGPTSGDNFMTEAESMKEVLMDFGVPASAIVLEDQSRNTRENATYSTNILRQRGIKSYFLVTSALHMRRSLNAFAQENLSIISAPCDFEGRTSFNLKDLIPSADALDGSGRAIKEWVGQIVY